jgi:hypothetical protein
MSAARSAVAVGIALGATLFAAGHVDMARAGTDAPVTPPRAVQVPIHRARVALDRATARMRGHRYAAAAVALRRARTYVVVAHRAAVRQIGAPPVDPESDETPGPVSVMAVLDFEHTLVTRAARSLDGATRDPGIDKTLTVTMRVRLKLLNRIASIDPEGGDDYGDGMADSLGIYSSEVAYLRTLLDRGRLTPRSRATLGSALRRSEQTLAKVNAAFGGGE